MTDLYTRPEPGLWKGRSSKKGDYLHEKIEFIHLDENPGQILKKGDFVLLGYSCDEGVKRNQGRPGAANGPLEIIKELAKLPCHHPKEVNIYHGGSICCQGNDMEAAQNALSEIVANLISYGVRPILLGGGHDISYGHYMGLMSIKPAIINLDAHFDLRKPVPSPNSGTPFYQIAEEYKDLEENFRYLVLGIRQNSNDKTLFKTAEKLGVNYIENSYLHHANFGELGDKIARFSSRQKAIYLTIDLDVFSSAYAPGVSAASPNGISPEIGDFLIREILKTGKVYSVDLAEMNPKFDRDGQTAKLAAGIINSIMRLWPYSNQDL